MAELVDISRTDDPRDIIHRAVQWAAEGAIFGLPSETAYLACTSVLHPAAVAELARSRGAGPITLLVKSPEEALDYFPQLTAASLKLLRRSWPGPLACGRRVVERQSLAASFPAEVRQAVAPEGRLLLRCPAHPVIQHLLRLLPAPLAAVGDFWSPPAGTAAELETQTGSRLAHIIDDGPARYGQPPTLVELDTADERGWTVLNEGVVSLRALQRVASEIVVFVCTGNTCRSPMAEAYFRHHAARRWNCTEEALVEHGVIVASAGLSAGLGSPPSPEAVEVLKQQNIDLSGHASQPLTDRLLLQADRVFTMTRGHRDSILSQYPELADRVQLLSQEQRDISDPIGSGFEQYQQCAAEIERQVRARLEEMK